MLLLRSAEALDSCNYLAVMGPAALGHLSYLSRLEWHLREAVAGSEWSWFDVPISDPVRLTVELVGDTR